MRIALIVSRILLGFSILSFLAALFYSLGDNRPFEGSAVKPDGTINRQPFNITGDVETDQALLDIQLNRLEGEVKIIASYKPLYMRISDFLFLAWLLLIAAYAVRVLAIPKAATTKGTQHE